MKPLYHLKLGASLLGVDPRLLTIAGFWSVLRGLRGYALATITSGTDGDHGSPSFHYNGLAIDLRSNDMNSDDVDELIDPLGDLARLICPHLQVVCEKQGEPSEHIHVEIDDPNGARPIVPRTIRRF